MVVTVIRWRGRGGIFSLKYSEKIPKIFIRDEVMLTSPSADPRGAFICRTKEPSKSLVGMQEVFTHTSCSALSTMLGV